MLLVDAILFISVPPGCAQGHTLASIAQPFTMSTVAPALRLLPASRHGHGSDDSRNTNEHKHMQPKRCGPDGAAPSCGGISAADAHHERRRTLTEYVPCINIINTYCIIACVRLSKASHAQAPTHG